MAESADFENEDKKLQDIFLEGWQSYEDLEETNISTNGSEFQAKVKKAMERFETATRVVSDIGMFSSNELIDEVSTDSLQYLLLPFFLGKLALKLQQQERAEVLKVAEIYFNDYLQRCQEYELGEPIPKKSTVDAADAAENGNANELAVLMRAAHSRNDKIAQFKRKKELEEAIKEMKEAVRNETVDDEVKRAFFIKFLKKSIIDANEELESLKLEKQMVEMRKMHMTTGGCADALPRSSTANATSKQNAHGHHHHQQPAKPKPKPLQPFIITRNAQQKAVFGMGYPSLPVMTVDEFYTQRVEDGVFPDEQKVAQMNQAQAIAAAQDPEEKEEQEKVEIEVQVDNDDDEYLARMRRMDEYKDVVRRGDGNRHNRS